MKRFLASALVLSSFSLFALVGCEDKSITSTDTKIKTPDGTKEVKDTKEIKETGSAPPTEPVKAPEAPAPK